MTNKNISATDLLNLRIKSVTTPTAHKAQLCQESSFTKRKQDRFISDLVKKKDLSYQDKAVIELMYLYGLRISEVLKVNVYDITNQGSVLIKGLKRSDNRIVYPVEFRSFWINAGSSVLPIGLIFSRFYYYRLFRKLGYSGKYGSNQKDSVTHYFRHELVLSLKKQGYDKRSISQFLSHRSLKSLDHYEKNKKEYN